MSCACDANRHLQLGTRTVPSQLPAPCGHPSRAPVSGREYDDDLDAKASAQGDHPAIATAASLGWRWRRSSFRPAGPYAIRSIGTGKQPTATSALPHVGCTRTAGQRSGDGGGRSVPACATFHQPRVVGVVLVPGPGVIAPSHSHARLPALEAGARRDRD